MYGNRKIESGEEEVEEEDVEVVKEEKVERGIGRGRRERIKRREREKRG